MFMINLINFIIWKKYMNPLMLIMSLVFFTLITSLSINMFMKLDFYSLMIFIAMIGGLMVMFMYFISLINFDKSTISNPFKKSNFIYWLLTLIFNLLVIYVIYIYLNIDYYPTIKDMHEICWKHLDILYVLNLIYSPQLIPLTGPIIFFILFCLFSIIKICEMTNKTMRKI